MANTATTAATTQPIMVVSGGQSMNTPQQTLAAPVGFGNVSLYVGDLDANVNEAQLFDLFNPVGTVVSVRVCRDQTRRSSLGYGYVNFANPQDAATAMDRLNFTPVNGKPIRIMFSHRDPSIRKSGYANIFIKNLDISIDNKLLHDTFAAFGTVLSCKIAVDNNGQSKGYGFVQFDREEAAQEAIKRLNGMLLNDKQVYVGLFVRRQERNRTNGSPKFTNVFVKNLSEIVTDEDLKKIFGPYGSITSAVVMKDANGNSKCFGFVNFQSPDSASAAVESLNGNTHDDKVWYVGRAQKRSEREAELKAKFERERLSRYEKLQGANLYLKNLDDSVDDQKLKELFSEFGAITSCKVMLDPQGVSKGSGFVAFSSPDEATKAMNEMNGKMIGKKPLYVAVAQRREERKAKLQAHFSQLRAQGGMPQVTPGMPGFYPGTPRLAPQPFFYGQGNPGIIPPQPAGYGFQQQMLPGIRPGLPPNFIAPYHLQRPGHPGQRFGMRRGGNAQQTQQSQGGNRRSNQGFRYLANARNNVDQSVFPQGLVGQMMPVPFDMSASAGRPGQMPMSALTSTLASASPETQRLLLGEQLFPLVENLEPDHAAKVTGMLLEMDQPEVLHLIESPDALRKKVAEAMNVLHAAAMGSDANGQLNGQLGSMSLNE